MNAAPIEIQGLHKSYKKLFSSQSAKAVAGVDLRVETGEVWALAGPNGAGKSTTLHCLLGLLKPDQGSVRLFGIDPRERRARQHIGFQSEIFFSYNYRSAMDVLRFYGGLSGLSGSRLDARASDVLKTVGLSDVANNRVGTFSKGMMQRLGLAQSILHEPELIIWDEPATGLDPEGRRLVIDLALQLKSEGKTILLSTHILADVERVCDHLAIIVQGKAVLSEKIAAIQQSNPDKSLEDIYLEKVRGTSSAL